MGELVPHPRPAAEAVRIMRVVMPVAVLAAICVVVGGLPRVMIARGLLGLVPLRAGITLYVIRDMRMTMAVHVIMAVRVSAIVCHMAYRGTPIRLQLPP
ncbi:hypothetical protein G7Z12_16885 [Streptomyces sp. ID38640]|uniref:hypothetical protein n=1 Tax=Streptomyces TaxID=1883 RepID=UPI00140ECE75|nr:hypothetical protein G7Z12_16885 [Streptomyces sp. ID38640]